MSGFKQRLIFDATDASSLAASDKVGSYVLSDDGTQITHHTVGSDEGLDVYLLNTSIVVTATDLDIRDLSSATDSVTAIQGTDPWIVGDGGNSLTVDAVDLDIRDLTQASDSIQGWLYDAAGNGLTSTLVGADQALDVNIVSGVNVEVDLSHVDDSVRLGDGTNFLTSTTVGSDIGLDVYAINDPSVANTAIANAAETLDVASTAQDIIVSPLANRKTVFVHNYDNREMFIGGTGVTAANGFPVFPGVTVELKAGAAVDIEYVSSKVNHEIRTLELS